MMESCLDNYGDRQVEINLEDVKRDLSSEFNMLQNSDCREEREHLRVYLRIRPFSSAESNNGESQNCVTVEAPETVLLKPPRLSLPLNSDKSFPQTGQRFQFSQVYGPETSQRELFKGTVKDLVKDVLEGGNSLVFTYGVTNGGKTFTFLGPDADAGVLPRALGMIFSSIVQQVFQGTSIKPHRCHEFTRLTREQQDKEALFKRNLLRQLKENEKNSASFSCSTNKSLYEGSSLLRTSAADDGPVSLQLETNTKFSIWVSFCEIYNDNIHDLLEALPSGASRRAALRLSQDVKGNTFVKDLRWVQVNSAEEAFLVMKLGKRNQSFSSTRLNHLSSRSHSIFSIRILKVEDVGTPRVQAVSELCLCDLAGSERCAKTLNKGERLKEAGNINTSLLILGKCINALRHNQKAKLLQHVPFRESKLTHYLQGFFCGRGKACMIVNINQCASMYDETLNVLKFSAVAQKVVVLSSRPPPVVPQRSSNEIAFIIEDANRRSLRSCRRSTLIGWETSLEDVQEDEDDDFEEEESVMEVTSAPSGNDEGDSDDDDDDDKVLLCRKTHQRQVALLEQLQAQLKTERAEGLLMEARVREEISKEFSDLFSNMQRDYNDSLGRERKILEDRSEKRLEIFKNLVSKMSSAEAGQGAMEQFLDSCSFELSCMKSSEEQQQDRGDGGRRPEVEDTGRLLFQLEEKSAQVARLEERVSKLQRELERRSDSHRLQESLAALEKEKRAQEETVAALEYQTVGKEEALASLEQERRSREEADTALRQLKQSKDEIQACLEWERKDKERETAALQEERKSREEAAASSLEEERKEVRRLAEESQRRQEESDALRQQLGEVRDKLEDAERQVTSQEERAEQAVSQLQAAQAQLAGHREEIQEKTSHINTLNKEVTRLKQERQTASMSSVSVCNELREEVTELRRTLAEERTEKESWSRRVQELEEELAQKHLVCEQQVEDFTQKMQQKDAASKQEVVELRRKAQEEEGDGSQQTAELQRLKQASNQEAERLTAKLEEQSKASSLQLEQLQEKLREQEKSLLKQLHEFQQKLSEQTTTTSDRLQELQEKLSKQEAAAELLRAELKERRLQGSPGISHCKAEELRRLNSEVTFLRAKMSTLEGAKESSSPGQATPPPAEVQEKLAKLQKKLLEKDAEITSLQKSLQEHKEQEESQAVREARHKEVERCRELLATAHEAIALKKAELDKRAEEINRLKENAVQDSEKVKNLSLALQSREDQSSDLREKLADYKKQVQQVHKEISIMREEEKVLRQKVADAEKTKKQLQCDLAVRDRSIQQLRTEQSSNTKSEQTLYQKACKDLEAQQCVMEDMRLALTEQEDTQQQMEQVLEEKLVLVQELSTELEKLRSMLMQTDQGDNQSLQEADSQSDDLKAAKDEAARAQECLQMHTEKHQAERRKWLEEKLSLIGQAKEAEDKRNQEMRKFAEDRERSSRQQSQLESQLAEQQQKMDTWRTDRDALVAALEVQLHKLLSSQADKDRVIQELSRNTQPPQEAGERGVQAAELQATLCEKEAEILQLKKQLKASQDNTLTLANSSQTLAARGRKPQSESTNRKSKGRDTRASVSSQGSSSSCPSVLDSSEISTENGRRSRFPQPELEISFSPLQPNRMALRRQGEEGAVTVKITRSGHKRKSAEMEKSHFFRRSKRRTKHEDDVEVENGKNTRCKRIPKLTTHQEESLHAATQLESHSGRKEGTLQKIGEFLQSSPTLLGSKAKKMMSLVSSRGDAGTSSSSLSLRGKKSKRKLYRPEISSPMEMPPHPIISREPEEKESDHQIIKRRLRSRMVK